LVGILPKFAAAPLSYLLQQSQSQGDVFRLDLGSRRFYFVNHPDGAKHVMQDNNKNYRKGYGELPLLGNGLVTSEGEFWRQQRRLMQPSFHRERIAGLATAMTDEAARMLTRWEDQARRNEPLDIYQEMLRVTMSVITRTMFGGDVEQDFDVLSPAFTTALEHMNSKMFSPLRIPDSWPTPLNRRNREAIQKIDEVVYRTIANRRSGKTHGNDLLAMLLEARDEDTGEGMSDQQLRDEVTTIYFAGHETTAATLSWTWYLLCQHPEAEIRMHEEVMRVLGEGVPTAANTAQLDFTRMVIEEAMRLYPPGWMFTRTANGADGICGYGIPKDATVMISPYVMHRDARWWENPAGFDPERFTPERSAGRPKTAYIPFAAGPRMCIGNQFSMMEAQLIAAMVVQRFRLHLMPGQKVEAKPMATLRPSPGVWVRLEAR
jgi:cytochrome P450